ncbi:hypothetical protein RB601_000634 [Gaeumannomyces tritici]
MARQPNQPACEGPPHASHDGDLYANGDDDDDDDDEKVNAKADRIIRQELHPDAYHEIDQELELDSRAERLLIHVWHLMVLLQHDRSLAWEQEYQIRDLAQEVQRLRSALRDSISVSDRVDPPLKPRTALEVVYEGRVKAAESHVADLLTKNWELKWRCRDLREHIKWLEMQLREDVSPGDVNWPSLEPKTALESSLEKKILELEEKMHNPKGRGRSSSV